MECLTLSSNLGTSFTAFTYSRSMARCNWPKHEIEEENNELVSPINEYAGDVLDGDSAGQQVDDQNPRGDELTPALEVNRFSANQN
ncbi:hypothetical protein WR25_20928 [Diploscapter pachys]|uniref:Uncharacterized protein n=1 Tax=Diploscapter pachys TaxID=2018661 RepID=A0A2A2KAQ8_9BILA|nr:hypothetical protein WR25_20928 [Diploscapter pachys]